MKYLEINGRSLGSEPPTRDGWYLVRLDGHHFTLVVEIKDGVDSSSGSRVEDFHGTWHGPYESQLVAHEAIPGQNT